MHGEKLACTSLEKATCCEATGSNTNAEHPKHSDDLDLLPPIAVTPAEQQRDPEGAAKKQKQIKNPPPLHEKVSSAAFLPVCLFCRPSL